MEPVRVEHVGHVRIVTLAQPERRNALSRELLMALIASISDHDGIRALIIRAEPGVSVWSAGHDISELPQDGSDALAWVNPLEELFRQVRQAPFPVIAAVEGTVWGGACNLVLACDLVVATRDSTYAITPAKLGIPYNSAGVAHFLSALPLNIAKEMFFTAQPISAEALASYGVVNRLVADSEELQTAALGLAEQIASLAPLAIRAIKSEMTALTDARPINADLFENLTSLRRSAWRSADYAEGLAAFHGRRIAQFEGR